MIKLDLNHLKKIGTRFLLNWEKQRQLPGLVGLNLSKDGFALTHIIQNTSGKPSLKVCDFILCAAKDFAQKLTETVNLHQLKGAACSWVLNRADYHLLLLDAPPVPVQELPSTIPWLIKDLIDFPVQDALLDFFTVSEAVMPNPKKIFVVVTQKNKLQEIASLINASGLRLVTIDINVLALRNLSALLTSDKQDIALLHLEHNGCSMVIIKALCVCLVRQINVTLDALDQTGSDSKQFKENLLDEIKRTMDYCALQPAVELVPRKIFLLPMAERYIEIEHYLCEALPELVEKVDFNAVLNIPAHINVSILAPCVTALCAALRQEDTL